MNKIPTLLFSLILLSLTLPSSALEKGYFASESLFSEGKWIGVAVGESGLYEITYDRLRELGFTDPGKVGVYGTGGAAMPEHFDDPDGEPLICGQIPEVPVIHTGNKLIFYAQGVTKISSGAPSSSSYTDHAAVYTHDNLNIYSRKGWYFITDRSSVEMPEASQPEATSSFRGALGFVCHEKPLAWNPFRGGKIYVGEEISSATLSISFDAPLADITSADRNAIVAGKVIGLVYDDTKSFTARLNEYSAVVNQIRNEYATLASFSVAGNLKSTGNRIRLQAPGVEKDDKIHLSSFIVNYPKQFPPADYDLKQERYLLDEALSGEPATIDLLKEGRLAVNITYPERPELIRPAAGNTTISVGFDKSLPVAGNTPDIIIFNPEATLLQIGETREVFPSHLRERAAIGADMLIICTPSLRDKAERLADIHKAVDGLRVLVATTEDIYNEFSSGTPDPMAYRSLVRMMRDAEIPLANVLLFGPLHADARGVEAVNQIDSNEFIIAWQTDFINDSSDNYAYNFNEFCALEEDYSSASIVNRKIAVGVGVVTVSSPQEAEIFIDKTAAFLTSTDFAYRLNNFLVAADSPNAHIHQSDAMASAENLKAVIDNDFITSPVMIDAIPQGQAGPEFIGKLMSAPILAAYIGHGQTSSMSTNFLSCADVLNINNRAATFMAFLGCDLTNFDRGIRGIGEQFLLNTKSGIVGGLISNRSTTSRSNRQAFLDFMVAMLRENGESSPLRRRPLSLGETCAKWKSASSGSSSLSMQLMADPALTLPLPTLGISLDTDTEDIQAGHYITVSGSINDIDGSILSDFNGEAVIRAMAPPETIECPHYNVTAAADKNDFSFEKGDVTVAMCSTKITDGHFEATITIPAGAASLNGEAKLFVAAYDPTLRLAAGATAPISYTPISGPLSSPDITAPSITELRFEPSDCTIRITASDDVALAYSTIPLDTDFTLLLDDRYVSHCDQNPPIFTDSQKEYSRVIPLGILSNGQHRAEVTIKDATGNSTTDELIFTVGLNEPAITLSAPQSALFDESEFTIEGLSAATATLYVATASGDILLTRSVSAPTFTWDGRDSQGRRLPTGVYTLHVKCSDGSYSNPIRLPLITL